MASSASARAALSVALVAAAGAAPVPQQSLVDRRRERAGLPVRKVAPLREPLTESEATLAQTGMTGASATEGEVDQSAAATAVSAAVSESDVPARRRPRVRSRHGASLMFPPTQVHVEMTRR